MCLSFWFQQYISNFYPRLNNFRLFFGIFNGEDLHVVKTSAYKKKLTENSSSSQLQTKCALGSNCLTQSWLEFEKILTNLDYCLKSNELLIFTHEVYVLKLK